MSDKLLELFSLRGRTALITGGSRGLGLQVAEALGGAGARLVLTARKQAELDAACQGLAAQGIEATAIAGDAADPAAVRAICDQALALGPVDILVNNAGATWGAAAVDYPLEAWDKVMNLNVRSVFLWSQTIARESMLPRKHGRIIMMASIAGLAGHREAPYTVAYNASKAAVINLTRALAGEWGPHGITVNALAPGFFPSRMTRGTLEACGEDTLARAAPLRRLGGDDDLKGAALLFASDAGRHITGQVLAVDGGVSCVLG